MSVMQKNTDWHKLGGRENIRRVNCFSETTEETGNGEEKHEAEAGSEVGEEHEGRREAGGGDRESLVERGSEEDSCGRKEAGEAETCKDSGRWTGCTGGICETAGRNVFRFAGELSSGQEPQQEGCPGVRQREPSVVHEGRWMDFKGVEAGDALTSRGVESAEDDGREREDAEGRTLWREGSRRPAVEGYYILGTGREESLIEIDRKYFGRPANLCVVSCGAALSVYRRCA